MGLVRGDIPQPIGSPTQSLIPTRLQGRPRQRELSSEWAAKGVRVNAIVCAQLLNAELEKHIAADPTLGDTYLRGIPMGAWATPTTSRAWRFFSPPTPQRGSPAR
jgi:hypothetical protein